MAGRGQMDPDLVCAAGARPRFDQGSSREALADAHLGGGLLPHPASDVDAGPSPGQWGLDQELVVLGPSSDQRQVAAVDGVSPEHRRQRGMGRVVLGHHQESRRSSVQAVHDAGPVLTAPSRQRNPHGQQPIDQRPRPSGRSGVGDQAGRLRHHEQVLVLVSHLHRLGLGRQLARFVKLGLDQLPAGQTKGFGAGRPVDPDPLLGDRPLSFGPRNVQRGRGDGVQPTRLGSEGYGAHRRRSPPARPSGASRRAPPAPRPRRWKRRLG